MAFRVKTHHWIDGILSFVEREFDSLEEAIAHANDVDHHNAKVFDEQGRVAHYIVKDIKQTTAVNPENTYA